MTNDLVSDQQFLTHDQQLKALLKYNKISLKD